MYNRKFMLSLTIIIVPLSYFIGLLIIENTDFDFFTLEPASSNPLIVIIIGYVPSAIVLTLIFLIFTLYKNEN
uniref:Group-specific protein n=1 Tax=Aliarcobacter butzleri TaxID=28197 RepID=W0LZG0_9BACT|nr:hypothetical protein [Aliarcobacter butzleri]